MFRQRALYGATIAGWHHRFVAGSSAKTMVATGKSVMNRSRGAGPKIEIFSRLASTVLSTLPVTMIAMSIAHETAIITRPLER